MLKDNVQYVTFKSGSKGSELTSNGETDDIFEDKVENTGISDDFTFTINPVYLANLKEVTVINDTFKGSLPIATQTRVILTDTLYDNGELLNPNNKKTLDNYLSGYDWTDDLVNWFNSEFNRDAEYVTF